MIEVIYKEEKQEAKNGENLFNLPRNIRQVGLTTGNMRIYIEDYVYTFLTRLARNAVGSGKEQGCVAVFTGETKWNNGITYLFIRGALMVEDMEAASAASEARIYSACGCSFSSSLASRMVITFPI